MSREEICTRISDNVKMAGFLEKKGKMKLVSPWKKYWFVLEERLLLYYKSQIEYINLSPCRGSLNMGLVSTVRPGSSTGPCIIHVITRTQVVQLRAKDRAVQEEWLQALLDSMSRPVVSKSLKPPSTGLHCIRYSMDNIPTSEQLNQEEIEQRQRTLPHRLSTRKNQMSGAMYGGSLDTAIWTKKFRPVRSPSPNIPKGKMLERILGFVEEAENTSMSDTVSLTAAENGSVVSLPKPSNSAQNLEVDTDQSLPERESRDYKCKVHDVNQNHDYYSTVDKSKKKNKVPVSNNVEESDKAKLRNKEESRFERIRNVITRRPKDKADVLKVENVKETDRVPREKKRRQSFLHKVFKRHYKKREPEVQDDESDLDDPLYDTIDNVQEQKEILASESKLEQKESLPSLTDKEDSLDKISNNDIEQPLYTAVQKPVFGSKSILSVQAMSELKNKLKSRESLERQEIEITRAKSDEIETELSEAFLKMKKREKDVAPELPPRRGSRPRSPWHDVPSNNAPVNDSGTNFNVHQSLVKFHDEVPVIVHECDENISEDSTESLKESECCENEIENKKKEDDLSALLEQLVEITTAPLTCSGLKTDNHSCSLDSDLFAAKPRMERRFSDPDYDIPRPHKLLFCATSETDRIPATEFFGRSEDTSETNSSLPSMEPDSLETDRAACKVK